MRLETLKKTNYTSKPRSRVKKSQIQTDKESHELDIKIEHNDSHSQNDMDLSDSEDIPEEDFTVIKALAMKKIFKCRECKQIFGSRFKLFNHRRTEHMTRGVCNICGRVVRSDNLKKHINLHSDGPCTCKECGKTFKNSESLRTHKFIHSENNYTCEICGKSFKLKSEHTRHLKKHEGRYSLYTVENEFILHVCLLDPDFRKVACSLCGKKVYELRKHMLTHTGEKPFTCERCNRGFSSRYALKIHSRQHTNEKPYICDHCGYASTQKVSLVTHLKSKHGIS